MSIIDCFLGAATFVDKILKGAKPGDRMKRRDAALILFALGVANAPG